MIRPAYTYPHSAYQSVNHNVPQSEDATNSQLDANEAREGPLFSNAAELRLYHD